jgi:hypothetical protein
MTMMMAIDQEKRKDEPMGNVPGGSTLKACKCRKSCLIGFAKSSEDTDHGNGGKHDRT